MEEKIQMTREEYERLQAELEERISRRPRIIEAIATARAHGDLSENAEYHAAREEQGQNEATIMTLEQQIEEAEIIEVVDDGVVGPGKLVTIRYEDDDDPETFLLAQRAMKDGADVEVLSPASPVGQALLGHSSGESVVANINEREVKLEIVSVTTP
jgi:transcription elongation factor GreA